MSELAGPHAKPGNRRRRRYWLALPAALLVFAGAWTLVHLTRRLIETEVSRRLEPIRHDLAEVTVLLSRMRGLPDAIRQIRGSIQQTQSQEQELARLAGRQTSDGRRLEAILQSIQSAAEKAEKLQSSISELERGLAAQGERIEACAATWGDSSEGLKKGVSESLSRLKGMESALAETQSLTRELQTALQKLRSAKDLNDAVLSLTDKIKELDNRLAGRLLTVEGKVGVLERKADALERQVLQIQAQPARP
jgi:DNA repair exonuclease SbcCD ATPase subunit